MKWLSRAFGGGRRAPRDVDGAMRSALLAVLDHDLEEAERLLSAAVSMDSSHMESYVALARVFREQGELGRAIRLHQNLLLRHDLNPQQTVDALVDLAADLEGGGFVERAIASYEEALGHDPRHPGALQALVRLQGLQGEHERALSAARKLGKILTEGAAERESGLRVNLAEAALAEGDLDVARRALKKALRLDPRSVRAWIALGGVEAERGKPRAALAAWSRVPAIDRTCGGQVYPRLAATYAALDRAREFEDFLRGLLDEEPDDPHARLALARTLATRGETDQAVATLRELLVRHPDDLDAHVEVCRVLVSAGREGEAGKELLALVDAMARRDVLRDEARLP